MGHVSLRVGPVRYSMARADSQPPTTGKPTISTQATDLVLAIESGGSGTRVALAGPSGAVLHLERCSSGSCLYRDRDDFSGVFGAALERALGAAGPEHGPIGLVGLAGPMDEPLVCRRLDQTLPGVPRRIFTEGDIARGLYDITAGVALIAGTGCSCSAVDEAGVLTSFGGFGPQFGDEGSAYWIGQEGLKAAFLAEQGRVEPTKLLDAARAFYGVTSPWGIHQEAEGSGHVPAPRIAAFAAEVDRCAREFDRTAMLILDAAGAHLGQLILDTTLRANLNSVPVPLVMTGGTLRAARVVAAIERKLAKSPILFAHHPIAHEPIHGLIRLLQQHVTT